MMMRHPDRLPARLTLGAIAAFVLGCGDATAPRDRPGADATTLPAQPIVFARFGSIGWDIVRVNPDGTGEITLTTNPGDDIYPSWSPDRTTIAFLSSRPDGAGVYTMNGDGSDQRLAFVPSGMAYMRAKPAWTPDKQWLAYGDGYSVTRTRIDGTDPRVLGAGDAPSWSPDGQRIVFESGGVFSTSDSILVANSDGGDRRLVAESGLDPAWSPDGRRIAYASGQWAQSYIYTVNIDGSDRRQVTTDMAESPVTTDLSPTWSPDGKWLAFQREYQVCSGQTKSCSGSYDIFVIRADGTDLHKVTSGGTNVRPSW
jgi:Tol biopolymer transport system component